MANRRFTSQFLSQFETMPVLLSCNFVVDSTNGNGLGIRSLKGEGIHAVYMNTSNGAAGTPALGSARGFSVLGATAVTNTGSSVLTGNLGISPGSSITGFPPGAFTGSEHITDGAAASAQASANAAYIALQARSSSTIATELGTQTLVPGVYSAASGTFTLNGTVTLNGAGVYVFQTATTLVTGGTSTPVFSLTNGAKASDIYFVVGSSATLNSAHAGTFQGNVIALTSITNTLAGTINGSLIALNGAVTLSAATAINAQPLAPAFLAPGNPNPNPGIIMVQLSDCYSRYLGGFSGQVSPLNGISSTSSSAGQANIIVALGTASLAQWQAVGLPLGVVPSVGLSFIPTSSAVIGGSAAVQLPAPLASLIDHIEVQGDANLTVSAVMAKPGQQNAIGQPNGGYLILEALNGSALQAPADGTVIGLSFYLSNSSNKVSGQ